MSETEIDYDDNFKDGIFLLILLLPCIPIGYFFLVQHLDSNFLGESSLGEPYITWVNNAKPLYWVVSILTYGITFLVSYFGRGKVILSIPYFMSIPILLMGLSFLVQYGIFLVKVEGGDYMSTFFTVFLCGLAVYTLDFIVFKHSKSTKHFNLLMLIMTIIIFIFSYYMKSTDDLYVFKGRGGKKAIL